MVFKLTRDAEAKWMSDSALQRTTQEDMTAEEYDQAGDRYFRNGERDKALEYWEEALQLDPDSATIKRKVRNKTIFFD